MNKSNLILASVSAIIFTSILIIFSPNSQKLNFSSSVPSPTPSESISPTPDPTADWKTYENNEFGISIKYDESKYLLQEKNQNFSIHEKELFGKDTHGYSVLNFSLILNKKVEDIINQIMLDKEIVESENVKVFSLKINNYNFSKVTGTSAIGNNYEHLYLQSLNNVIQISSSGGISGDFSQILSTFKFIETSSQKTPAVIPRGWKSDSYRSDSGHGKAFTIAYPSSWFFEGIVFRNFDYNNLNPSSKLRPEYVKCDVYDSSSGSSTLFNIVDFATDIVEIARESDNSYKIIRGNHKMDIGEGVVTTYQLSTNGNIFANVTCYAFTKSDAKIVDQIVKTIRY